MLHSDFQQLSWIVPLKRKYAHMCIHAKRCTMLYSINRQMLRISRRRFPSYVYKYAQHMKICNQDTRCALSICRWQGYIQVYMCTHVCVCMCASYGSSEASVDITNKIDVPRHTCIRYAHTHMRRYIHIHISARYICSVHTPGNWCGCIRAYIRKYKWHITPQPNSQERLCLLYTKITLML